MKKFVALLLALALVVTGIAAAMADYDMVASMKKWVDVDLGGYKVVQLFNYNESVAVNVDGKTVTWWHKLADPKTLVNGDDPDLPGFPTNYQGWYISDGNDDLDQYMVGNPGDTDYGPDGLDIYGGGVGTGTTPAYEVDRPNYPGNVIDVWQATGEATMWIQNGVAKEETNPHGKSTPKDAAHDVRYVISGTYVAGFEVGKEILDNGSTKNVVPVDLTVEENTVFVYPIATNSHVVIGLLFAKVNVEEGFVQIEVQYKDELYRDWGTTLEVFTNRAQLVDSGADYELAEPISIEEELGGAQAILVSITGKVTYPTLFGNLKSGKWLAYQDYYRYEKWVKSYRTNLAAALALVPEE